MPVALKDVLVEEVDTAVTDGHCIGRPFADVLSVKEVGLKFVFGNLFGALPVKVCDHAHSAGLSLLRAFPLAIELKGFDHFVVPAHHWRVNLASPRNRIYEMILSPPCPPLVDHEVIWRGMIGER
jgi:hypothetical protein